MHKALDAFIHDLNVARRQQAAYPPGHPLIESASQRLLSRLAPLFREREQITLGVSSDGLLFERHWLDRNNPALRDFAARLSQLRVASISFRRTPTAGELSALNRILGLDRDRLVQAGGLTAVLEGAQLVHIDLTAVDYAAFQATAGEPGATAPGTTDKLWETFLQRLIAEQQGLSGEDIPLTPDAAAALLNQYYRHQAGPERGAAAHGDASTTAALEPFLQGLAQAGPQQGELQDRFLQLFKELTPELQQRLLSSSLRPLAAAPQLAEALLGQLPGGSLATLVELTETRQTELPPQFLQIVGQLTGQRQAQAGSVTAGRSSTTDRQLRAQLNALFREEQQGKFAPESYQDLLSRVASGEGPGQRADPDLARLRRQLLDSPSERQCAAVLLRLLRADLPVVLATGLQANLIELAWYFLDIADFQGIHFIHRVIRRFRHRHPKAPPALTSKLLKELDDARFKLALLEQLQYFASSKQDALQAYIRATGASFADSLIERLATDESYRRRRFYLNCLIAMGAAAQPAIYARLDDPRWYLVRNLLHVLGHQQTVELDVKGLLSLANHPHPRVVKELLELVFKHDRARAEELLLEQLASANQELLQAVIQVAALSRSSAVVARLIALLEDKVSEQNLATQVSAVKILALLKAPEALPVLEERLFANWLFSSAEQKELKLEIARSLEGFPPGQVRPIYTRLAKGRRGELRTIAEDRLRKRQRTKG